MKVLGLRASAAEVRYALLEKNYNNEIVFINQHTENKLVWPATTSTVEEKLVWIKAELVRILRQNNNIEKIAIKTNEFAGTETRAKRETTYIDAIFILVAAEHNISVVKKLNNQIGSTSQKCKELAENCTGRTEKYWNTTIADAILVAYSEIRR